MAIREQNKEEILSTERDSYFISMKTIHNLMVLTRGYIGYANKLIKYCGDEYYAPALHCNQSSIEGLFSCIRMMANNRTDLYTGGIVQQNIFNEIKIVKKLQASTSYSARATETNHRYDDHAEVDIKWVGENI